MARNGDNELKIAYLLKRSINKSVLLTGENYRNRLFVLTDTHLSYYDGKPDKKGKPKGQIELKNIKVVEAVEDGMLDNKDNVFQIVYQENSDTYTLYVVALDKTSREDWIEAIKKESIRNKAEFLHKYHKGVWTKKKGKYNCCDQIDRNAPGCEMLQDTRAQCHTPAGSTGKKVINRKLPSPPLTNGPAKAKQEKLVYIAIYDFEPAEDGDLELIQGEEYTILDKSKEHWWQAEDRNKRSGYIPANYVKKKFGLEIYGWYYKDITRDRTESILMEQAKEGGFLVRDSTSTPGLYTVSVYTENGKVGRDSVSHYHIRKNVNEQFYISHQHCFETIPELIHYHKHNSGGLTTRLREPPNQNNKPSTAGLGHSKWEIDPANLQLGEELGSGCFGTVFKGLLSGKPVAVKTLKDLSMSEAGFIEEARTMTQLSHPNLVQLYGIVTKNEPLCIITELMRSGALSTYLKRHRTATLKKPATMLDFCLQVCSGMVYLEQRGFIHRDLAARNCLVGENQVVKVADFGLTRYVLDDEYRSSVGTKFPVKWAAPEVLSFTLFSSKSDVWAFGILIWEIFTAGETPYGKMRNAEVVDHIVEYNKRLEKPDSCPEFLYILMNECWKAVCK
ncbi:tyrosine-protein kinase ITK/TSK [Patella vulgata]|uniref:tyrosine-protein kinase ITK/TSK n=1 Tax=Patella vulgata TaxID=6465 RepID=UPI0024A90EB8|nr:tyrosine-protein kinase ITK/TSK [Patella vulgata]